MNQVNMNTSQERDTLNLKDRRSAFATTQQEFDTFPKVEYKRMTYTPANVSYHREMYEPSKSPSEYSQKELNEKLTPKSQARINQ